jgi:hypothetical protein
VWRLWLPSSSLAGLAEAMRGFGAKEVLYQFFVLCAGRSIKDRQIKIHSAVPYCLIDFNLSLPRLGGGIIRRELKN